MPLHTLALSPDEFRARWPAPPGPLGEYPLIAGSDAVIICLVDPDTQALLGYWPVFQAVHVDGLWLEPALKGQDPGALRSLLEGVFATLSANQVPVAFVVLADDAGSRTQAERLGFTRAPGNLYMLPIPRSG